MIEYPEFADKDEMFEWLIAKKSILINQKKSAIKEADAVRTPGGLFLFDKAGTTIKADEGGIPASATRIKVVAVINTTKVFDSHGDVHIDGLWNKSLKENKDDYLVKSHQFNWEGIISDNVKVYTKTMRFKDMGIDLPGETQALIYEAIIDKSENELMFTKYRDGKVKQHSVGMRYVKMDMAISDPRYEKEHGVWEKYYGQIANKADVDAKGYFWAVTEAKNIEGSALLRGANFATPTLSVTQAKGEPPMGTRDKEPVSPLKHLNQLIKTKNIFG
jgi:hypothetical protein